MPGLIARTSLASVVVMAPACDHPIAATADDVDFDEPRQAGFVPAPDFGGGTIVDCDLFLQDCPAGDKCMPWANDGGSAWNAARCSPVAPNAGAPGEACTVDGSGVSGLDDCERGAMCWDVDPETNEGTCIALLVGSGVHPICANPIGVPYLSADTLALCLPGCDPLAFDCGPGLGCYPRARGFACLPDVSGDNGGLGELCRFPNACGSGLVCLAAEVVPGCFGGGCCSAYCDVDAPICPEGTTCQPWWDGPPPTPYQTNLGICAS